MTGSLREWGLVLLVILLGVAQTGCRKGAQPQSDVLITHEIAPQPPKVGHATVTLKVTDAEGHAIAGAKISLEGNMSHAGMSPVFAEALEVAPGSYQAPFEFTMSGDWVLLVNLTLPDGRRLQRQLDVKGVQPD